MVNVRGDLTGEINNVKIETDMHAFVYTLPSDGRNYIVTRYPKEIGSDSTLTLLFATSIHWLLAGSETQTLNGFGMTGKLIGRQYFIFGS